MIILKYVMIFNCHHESVTVGYPVLGCGCIVESGPSPGLTLSR